MLEQLIITTSPWPPVCDIWQFPETSIVFKLFFLLYHLSLPNWRQSRESVTIPDCISSLKNVPQKFLKYSSWKNKKYVLYSGRAVKYVHIWPPQACTLTMYIYVFDTEKVSEVLKPVLALVVQIQIKMVKNIYLDTKIFLLWCLGGKIRKVPEHFVGIVVCLGVHLAVLKSCFIN